MSTRIHPGKKVVNRTSQSWKGVVTKRWYVPDSDTHYINVRDNSGYLTTYRLYEWKRQS